LWLKVCRCRFGSRRDALFFQLGEAVGEVLQDLPEVLDLGFCLLGAVQSVTRERERDSSEDDSNEPTDEFHKRTMCCGAYAETKRPAKVAGRCEGR
jgi:hypothetical protein